MNPMKYQMHQKVAYAYFVCAMALFAIQVLGGLLAGWIYVSPNFLSDLLPFNIIRMIHTNALIVWLLLGFFGAAYFLVPEESEREIYSVKLAYLQLIILMVGTLGAVGILPGGHPRWARVSGTTALGQIRHPGRRVDLSCSTSR